MIFKTVSKHKMNNAQNKIIDSIFFLENEI